MRLQTQRIPAGHRLLPINGKLVAIPISSVGVFQAASHNVGYGTGASARVIAEPVIMVKDLLGGLCNMVAGSQFGQSAKLGWHDVGHLKSEWQTGRQLREVDPQSKRLMLVETVQGPQKGAWSLIVMKMSDAEVSRELARRMTPNSYIDEELTYNGQEMDYEVPNPSTAQPQRAPQVQAHAGTASPNLMGSFAQ